MALSATASAADTSVTGQPFTGDQIAAAYRAIYGGLPGGMTNKDGSLADAYQSVFPRTVLKTPTGEPINASQLMYMYQKGGGGNQNQAPAAQTQGQSYLMPSGGSGGSGNMTWNDISNYGYSAADLAAFQQRGWTPEQVWDSTGKGYAKPSTSTASTPVQNAFGISQAGSGNGYTILQNNNTGKNIAVDSAGNYFDIDSSGNHIPVSDAQAVARGFQSQNPETNALKQMQAIDPASEALRQQLSGSYLDPSKAASPTAADYQSYLNTFKQVDPEEYAQRQGLATSMDSYLKMAQDQANLGSQLDPVTARQVEQQTRAGQAARGNVYGTPQMVKEAMTTGQAGEALRQQRMANLQSALGTQQGYLGAGLGLGDTAMNLYQQGLSNKAQAQQSALGYLGSAQTPYQAGASYLSNAEGTAGSAAQGGPQYNPAALGQSYTGSAGQAPQYGLDVGAQAQNWYNSLSANQSYGAAPSKNRAVGAAAGAASGLATGAASGAAMGTTLGPYGTAIGAGVGALAGGLSGYYS